MCRATLFIITQNRKLRCPSHHKRVNEAQRSHVTKRNEPHVQATTRMISSTFCVDKGPHAVWFHFYDNLEEAKLQGWETDECLQGTRGEGD